MIRRALLAAAIALSAAGTAFASALEVWVDPDGSAYLQNTTASPISFNRYLIGSETNRLDPVNWNSISDQAAANPLDVNALLGSGALTFGKANPGAGNLAELNLEGFGTLQPGASFSIGKPFLDHGDPGGAAVFFWGQSNNIESSLGDIVVVPEPSTFLLAAMAGMGLVAFRQNRVRSKR